MSKSDPDAIAGPVILGIFALFFLAFAGFETHAAYSERAQAGQFLAAPRCAGGAVPLGDCVAWQTRTVSQVNADKSGLHIYLADGSLRVWYLESSGWVGGLKAGETVPVLMWEGAAQALRDPRGHVLYGEGSALHEGDSDIGGAVMTAGMGLASMTGAFAFAPWFRRRSPRYGPLLTVTLIDAGISGMLSGVVIQSANSVETGVTVGVIAFCVIGIIAVVFNWPLRIRKRTAHG